MNCGCKVERYFIDSEGHFDDHIIFCSLHMAAGKMKDLLQKIKDHADLNMSLSLSNPKPLYHEVEAVLEQALAAVKKGE